MSRLIIGNSEITASVCRISLSVTDGTARRICWRDARIQAVLATLSAGGLSAGAIAQMLGCNRDQVAGAMRRYGLFARG